LPIVSAFTERSTIPLCEQQSTKSGGRNQTLERLTIAKEVRAERKHQKAKANSTREQTKQQVQKICYALLEKYKGTGITGHSMFLYDLNKNGIAIERIKNKQGKVYGSKFSFGGQNFMASEISREFGYRSL